MTKITLTKALVELKKLDQQIARGTSVEFIGYTTGTGVWEKTSNRAYSDKDVAAKAYKSAFDSVQGLIEKRTKLKSALVKANAVTQVQIGDLESMTIAEAIERKNSITLKRTLLSSLRQQHANAVVKVTHLDTSMQNEVSSSRQQLASQGKADDAKLKQVSDDIASKTKAVLNDPNKLQDVIEELEKEIEDFLSNVDVALSVANATTEIDV